MGGAPNPEGIAAAAKDIVAFEVVAVEPGTNGAPPRGQIWIRDALRGDLPEGKRDVTFLPPAGPRVHDRCIAVVYPQPDGSVAVDARAIWPDNDLHRARVLWGSNAAVTIITCDADHPDSFEALERDERRRNSGGWKRLPLRSGLYLDTFLMFATHNDFGVFQAEDELDRDGEKVETNMIDGDTIKRVVAVLEQLVEEEPDRTARLLFEHGGATADIDRVVEGLRTGTWPVSADPAEEAAAFAYHLLTHGRYAIESLMGVCWEYRGEVRALLTPPPTERRRELETLYARVRNATLAQQAAAKAALEVLVAKTRAEAPAELDAWALAHYCILSQFIHERAERGETESTAVSVALRERTEWAGFRAGTRAFVDETVDHAATNTYFYRLYLGIDPSTHLRVE